MYKCISCANKIEIFRHFSGGYVCEKCLGGYFTCTQCGTMYDMDDRVNGDSRDGNCVKCNKERDIEYGKNNCNL